MTVPEVNSENKDPFLRGRGEGKHSTLSTGGWLDASVVEARAVDRDNPGHYFCFRKGSIYLGETMAEKSLPVGWKDDRHIVTIAGSRAGKGRCAIIPNLKVYPGSVICLDPKGENAEATAELRSRPKRLGGLGQEVYVLDPFNVAKVPDQFKATFNPFWMIEPGSDEVLEQISSIAESIVIDGSQQDMHWNDSAKALIESLIAHVLTWPDYAGDRTLGCVRDLLVGKLMSHDHEASPRDKIRFPAELNSDENNSGGGYEIDENDPFQRLLAQMLRNDSFDGVIAAQARTLLTMSFEERGSIMSTAKRNTKFLDGRGIRQVLTKSDHNLAMKRFKRSALGATLYVCLPVRYMNTHARWFRLIVDAIMTSVEQDDVVFTPPSSSNPDTIQPRRSRTACGHDILAILDEFPVLGNMKKIETAIGFMAGFGLKIWIILQDLNQLKRDYPRSWETFLGNAGTRQFFGITDTTTLDYISRIIGETEIEPKETQKSASRTSVENRPSDEEIRRGYESRGFLTPKFTADGEFLSTSSQDQQGWSQSSRLMKTALMTGDEIHREFARGTNRQLVLLAGLKPIYLKLVKHDDEAKIAGKYWENLAR